MSQRIRGRGWVALLAWALAIPSAQGEPPIDAKVALPLMLKVLTYDAAFGKRGEGDFVVLVASEAAGASARSDLLRLIPTLGVTAVRNRPLKFIDLELSEALVLAARARETKATAILALPGLSNAAINQIAKAAQDLQIYTLALDAGMVERGLCLGVASKDSKPQIVINAQAAKAIGARYDPSLLRLARMVQMPGAAPEPSGPAIEFTEAMTPPQFVSGPDPEYTQQAIDHQVEGAVTVKCVISVQGDVRGCKVTHSVPFMDSAVVEALEHRRYAPATLQGKAVAVEYPFRIVLKMPQ